MNTLVTIYFLLHVNAILQVNGGVGVLYCGPASIVVKHSKPHAEPLLTAIILGLVGHPKKLSLIKA